MRLITDSVQFSCSARLPQKMWVSHSGTSVVLPLGELPARHFWVENGPVKEARGLVGSSASRSSHE